MYLRKSNGRRNAGGIGKLSRFSQIIWRIFHETLDMKILKILIVYTCRRRQVVPGGATDKKIFVKNSLNILAITVLCVVIFVVSAFDPSQRYWWGILGVRVVP